MIGDLLDALELARVVSQPPGQFIPSGTTTRLREVLEKLGGADALRARLEALQRVADASAALRQAELYAHALDATRFPDEEVRSATEQAGEKYDAWVAVVDNLKGEL